MKIKLIMYEKFLKEIPFSHLMSQNLNYSKKLIKHKDHCTEIIALYSVAEDSVVTYFLFLDASIREKCIKLLF